MESCASFSNSWRSAGEYSQVSGGLIVCGCSDGGDIVVLSSPAEDEGTPFAALYGVTIDLPPERHKIIDGGNQRQPHHHPDRGQRDRVHRQVKEVPRQVRPVVIDDRSYHGE